MRGRSFAECISTTVPRKPPSRTSRFEPRPTKSTGSSRGRLAQELAEVVQDPRRRRSDRRAARAPADVAAHRLVVPELPRVAKWSVSAMFM
jgi:hypothetical protein